MINSENPKRRVFNYLNLSILTFLLVFMPLARGGVQPWAKSIFLACVALMVIVLLIEKIVTGQPAFQTTPLDYPLSAITVSAIISGIFSVYVPASVEGVMLFLGYLLFFYSSIHIIRTRRQQRYIVYLVICIAIVLCLIGLLKRFDLLPLGWWLYEQHQGSNYVTASYGNHNHLAGYLEMVIPLMLGLFLTRSYRLHAIILLVYLVLLLVVVHIFALSRGGWVSLSLALLTMLIILILQRRFRRKKLLLTISASVVVVVLFVLSSTNTLQRLLTMFETESAIGLSGRFIAWQGVVDMIYSHPILGTGPGTFASVFPNFQLPGIAARFFYAHNDYLQLISDIGLFFIPLLFWLIYSLYRTLKHKLKLPSRQTWGISLGAAMGVLALLFHSFGDFNLFIPANAMLFTLLVALVTSGPQRSKNMNSR